VRVDALGSVGLGVAIFALALGTTLFNPAIKALIPELTPPRHLTTAAALFQVADYASLVVGPLVAALLVPRFGAMNLLWLDAATFAFSAGCLALLPRRGGAPARSPAPARELLAEIGAGLRAVVADPLLRLLLALAVLDNGLTMGLLHVAAPLYVRDVLSLGTDAYLRAQTFFFLGMTVASAAFWLVGRRWPKGPVIIAGLVLDGLTLVPVALCRTAWQLDLALFVHACAIPLIIIPRTVLVQQRVPGALHGRTFALLNVTVFGMMAISSGITGVLAELVPVRTLFVVLGTAGLVPGLLGLASRALRSER
jgi:MFS family permease